MQGVCLESPFTPSTNLCETREGHEFLSYETVDITIASSLYGVLPGLLGQCISVTCPRETAQRLARTT